MRVAILDDYTGATFSSADWAAAKGLTVVPFTDHVHDEDQLVARLEGFDAVMRIRERTEFPRRVLERLPQMRLLLATGMRNGDSIDLPAARDLGITVCGTAVLPLTTVELTWALILGLMRRIPQETASLRAGGWQVVPGQTLAEKTLGIVGLGRMGVPVARVGQAFGMKVIAWSPNLTPERAAPHGVDCVTKEDLFRRSDVVTLHVPDAPATKGLVGAADLGAMRPTAYFINTSRPSLVDQEALVAALRHNRIGGAGLDVFPIEPLPVDDPFRSLPNVLATPHIGFVTEENLRIFFSQSLENIEAFRAGAPLRVIS